MSNKCIVCNKRKKDNDHKCCPMCAVKGRRNPFYGKRHSKKTNKINSLKHKGINSSFYIDGRSLKKSYCVDCNKKLIDNRAKRCKHCAAVMNSKKTKNLQHAVGSYMQKKMYKVIKKYFIDAKYNYFVKTKTWRFLDVAVPNLMLDFEYNGMRHLFSDRKKEDKKRKNELNKLGWQVIIINKNNYKKLENILLMTFLDNKINLEKNLTK